MSATTWLRPAAALAVLGLLAACAPSTRPAAAEPTPLVAAHYMHGASADCAPLDTPTRVNGRIGRTTDEQVALAGDALAAARQDVRDARAAGVDAFALWMHPRFADPALPPGGYRDALQRLEPLFQALAEDGGVTAYPDFWWYRMEPANWAVIDPNWKSPPVASAEAELRRLGALLADLAARHGRVWTRRDGRLVIGMQDHALFATVPYAQAMEWLCGPLGGRGKVYLALSRYPSRGDLAADWLAGADAIFDWDTVRSYGDSRRELAAGAAFARKHGKAWWPGFAPGFHVSRTGDATAPPAPVVHERLGVIAYRQAWLDAIRARAPAVYLATWNDGSEDSEVMPTAAHGRAVLRLTAHLSRWLRDGRPPAIEVEELLLFHHPQAVQGVALPPGRPAAAGVPGALTPPTDYLALCSFLKAPAEVVVRLQRREIARRTLPAGFHTWLIYHPAADPQAVYPAEEDGLSVTRLEQPFRDHEVFVEVMAGERRLARFRSHQPIVNAAGRGDLSTVGDVFALTR
jgi:hypothetical protein